MLRNKLAHLVFAENGLLTVLARTYKPFKALLAQREAAFQSAQHRLLTPQETQHYVDFLNLLVAVRPKLRQSHPHSLIARIDGVIQTLKQNQIDAATSQLEAILQRPTARKIRTNHHR